jgi:CheY-like chemotaxis protein
MSIRLLIVDDDLIIRNLLKRHFLGHGYDVEVAVDGLDALEKLGRAKYDIMVTDLMMPNLDGLELLTRVRDDYPMLRCIVMTGAVTIDNMLACLKQGAFTFVTKPLDNLAPLTDAVHVSAWVIQGWLEQLAKLQRMKLRENAS